MRRFASFAAFIVLLGLAAAAADCTSSTALCTRDIACNICISEGDCYVGLCLAPPGSTDRYCTFKDSACATGWRWDPSAEHGAGNTCVPQLPDQLSPDGGALDGGSH
jgi:hypothetical protein